MVRSKMVVILFFCFVPLIAQQQEVGASAAPVPYSCFSFTKRPADSRVCVSRNGNIVSLWYAGIESIAYGEILEGYAMRWGLGGVYFAKDLGSQEEGWGPATVSQPAPNTPPLTITRVSLNGQIRLKQVIGRQTSLAAVTVSMTVTNISGSTITGTLCRYVDFDIAGKTNSDGKYVSHFVTSYVSGSAFLPPWGGVTVRKLDGYYYSIPVFIVDWPRATFACLDDENFGAEGSYAPPEVDRLIKVKWPIEGIRPGQSKTVTLSYEGF